MCVCLCVFYLRCQGIVFCRLRRQQDMREAFLLPHHDVPESTVALILSHVVSETLVEHVALLLGQFALNGAVQMQLAIGQSRTCRSRGGYDKRTKSWIWEKWGEFYTAQQRQRLILARKLYCNLVTRFIP